MPLQNSQYDTLMRRYEEIRETHRHELLSREAEIAEKIPGITALDDRAAAASIAAAKRRIISPDADLSSYEEEMHKITEERTRLLTGHGYPADYLEMQYDCPLCRDTGFIDGARCACFKKASIDLLYSEYSISHVLEKENFRNFSFDWYSDTIQNELTGRTERQTARDAVMRAKHFISNAGRPDNNLYIYGNTGVGKTFLTHCIAKEMLDRSYSSLYFSARDFFDLLADATFGRDGRNSTHSQMILDCDFLTIDDLGTEVTNSFAASQLFHVLNERIAKNRSTIISTNMTPEEFSAAYTQRIYSRLLSHYKFIKLVGTDIRIQKKLRGGIS